MRKVKLTLLSLLALGAMSLASCTGAQGEKGDKGDQGEQGPQGEPGENGEDGEDGSLWYTGEGVPSADLGKEGDMYLDTSTNDVYQKEASGWVLKTNIQGDKGEDGEDGENGRPGSDGSNGKTAWSNTILPSEHGYVTADVGSAVVGDDVTFTVYPASTYYLDELVIFNNEVEVNLPKGVVNDDGTVSYTLDMMSNGFVVFATFTDTAASTSYYEGGQLYTGAVVDGMGNIISRGSVDSSAPEFEGGDGLTSETPLVVSTAEQFENIDNAAVENAGASYFELGANIETTNGLPVGKKEETHINLGSNTLTVNGGESGDNQTVIGGSENSAKTLVLTGDDGAKLTYNNKDSSNATKTSLKLNEGGELLVDNVDIESNGTAIAAFGESDITIKDSKIKGDAYAVGTNAGNVEDPVVNITIDNSVLENTSENSNDSAAILFNVNGKLKVTDSTVNGGKIGIFVRGGEAEIENTTVTHKGILDDGNDYSDQNWGDSTKTPSAAILIGNRQAGGYTESSNVSLRNIKTQKVTASSSEEASLSVSEENTDQESTSKKDYLLYAWADNNHKVTLNYDNASYRSFTSGEYFISDAVEETGSFEEENVFVNGQLYSKGLIDSQGNIEVDESNAVTGVKFESGNGLNEETALVISNEEQFNLLITNSVVSNSGYYFKLVNDIDTSSFEEFKKENRFKGHLIGVADGNGEYPTIKASYKNFPNRGLFYYADNFSIENINFVTDSCSLVIYSNYYSYGETVFKNINITGDFGGTFSNINNESVLLACGYGKSYLLDNVNIGVNFRFEGPNYSGYNGVFFGGYLQNDHLSSVDITIINSSFDGSITGPNVALLFGNNHKCDYSKINFVFTNNTISGDIIGYKSAKLMCAVDETYTNDMFKEKFGSGFNFTGNISQCNNESFNLSKTTGNDPHKFELEYSGEEKIGKIEISYSYFFKYETVDSMNNTSRYEYLYKTFEAEDIVDNKVSFNRIKFAYDSYTGNEEYVIKLDVESIRESLQGDCTAFYFSDKDEDKSTFTTSYLTGYAKIFSEDGRVIGLITLN